MFPETVLVEVMDKRYFPRKADPYSAGFDLRVESVECSGVSETRGKIRFSIPPFSTVAVNCGFKMALPKDLFGMIVPRSSWRRRGLICMAIYDPGYLETVSPFVTNLTSSFLVIEQDERVLQLLLFPLEYIMLRNVDKLDNDLYNRGGGNGSTGK